VTVEAYSMRSEMVDEILEDIHKTWFDIMEGDGGVT